MSCTLTKSLKPPKAFLLLISLLFNASLVFSQAMAFHSLLLSLLILPSLTLLPPTESQLTLDYYNQTCPKFHAIIAQVITTKQISSPTTAAGALRLFFHDCMVEGCDASLLIASNAFHTSERDADINLSIPGDAFDLITHVKTALELQCPGIVSCADILAVAARDLVTMVGGPYYEVRLGRKDGLVANASVVEGHIARPNASMTKIINTFDSKGLNIEDLVALSGAHTIGFSHCSQFIDRIFNFSETSQSDPSLNPNFAAGLRKLCSNYTTDPSLSAFNDVITPGKFDNMYYLNLQRGLGLLASDQALVTDPRTKRYVDLYAKNQTAFFEGFVHAIVKVSMYKVKTGEKGEVRRRCDAFNSITTEH